MEIRQGGEIQSFGGIEEFLTTRSTKEHKDGHVFLVFVVCVCFVAEQCFERRREEGVSEFRSIFCCLLSGFPIFYPMGWVKRGGRVDKTENTLQVRLISNCVTYTITF
jgi:hypothetical protein